VTGQLLACDLPHFLEAFRRRVAKGEPVTLTGLDRLEPGQAGELLDAFLHDPAATAPIEPFASLLSALVNRQETALWELFPVAGAEAFLRALPREHPDCMVCPCFPICQGYGAWARSCATWLRLLTGLAGAARELRRLRGRETPARSGQRSPHAPPS
jgi:hypothetical protein